MLNFKNAQDFAQDWIDSWNSHDLERILSHYADDFEMTSPFITLIANESSGTLKGKEQVGNYWQKSLEKFPDLHFELIDYLVSINSLIIYYISVQGRQAAEFLWFGEDGKV
jgi:ketosteroid isomerase-like protein